MRSGEGRGLKRGEMGKGTRMTDLTCWVQVNMDEVDCLGSLLIPSRL